MLFFHQNLNSIQKEEDFLPQIRSSVSGASIVSGTLTPVFQQRHMWGVSNGQATVSMKQHILIAKDKINGQATVSGTLTEA